MKFLEIREGLSVAIDKIESVEDFGMGSKVNTTIGVQYESVFPRNILLQLIEDSIEQNLDEKILEQLVQLNSNNQYYSG